MHVERYCNDLNKWVSADYFALLPESTLDNPKFSFIPIYDARNYALFGVLAGVRGSAVNNQIDAPRGLPKDVSSMVKEDYIDWDMDAHSCSYLTLRELIEFDEHEWDESEEPEHLLEPLIERLKIRADELHLIWDFCWSGSSRLKSLEKAEKIRIVFWFDN
jgi:hypothetical protein